MTRRRKAIIGVLAASCVLCTAFAFGCSQHTTYYTVTFMDGQTQVGEPIKVQKGKRITEYPAVTRADDEYAYLDGWCMDGELTKVWNEQTERVTCNITLYANFLRITEAPSIPSMSGEAFSNTLTWLQRGVTDSTAYSVELISGVKVSADEYEYSGETYYSESNCTVEINNYKGEEDIYQVKWTPAEIPAGGVYQANITCGEDTVTFGGLLYKGEGTEENPYLVSDATDFAAINTADVPENTYYKMLNPVVVRVASSKVAGHTFNGNLDGNGKTVTIEASDCGLFATLGEKANVYDLNVDGGIAGVSVDGAGVIASVNNGSISYCNVSATVTSDLGTIGLLEVEDGKMTGGAGGFVGINNGTVTNCAFKGTVQASVGAGGIAAVNYGKVEYCTNGGTLGAGNANETGSSTKKYSYMGGIVAANYGTVAKCATTGSGKLLAQRSESGDSPNNNIGGIAAYNAQGGEITECWFDGIRVHGNKNIGGIAGENAGAVSYCFASGAYKSGSGLHSYVGGYANVGGIVGLASGNGSVSNCYVTANVYAYGGEAYSIAQNCFNGIYVGGNLDIKSTRAVAAPQGEGNIAVEITDEIRAEYEKKNYVLALDEAKLATLNGELEEGETGKFSAGARLVCEGFTTVKEHRITVVLHGATLVEDRVSNISGNTVSLSKNNAPAAADGYYLAGWSMKQGGKLVFGTKAIGYSDLADFGLSTVELYPVYAEGEDPFDKVLDVAVYASYVEEDTVKALMEAFEAYCTQNNIEVSDFTYTMLGDSKTSVGAFCTLVSQGSYNVMFGQRANLTITVIGNADTRLVVNGSVRRIAKVSEGTAANAFYDFVLNNDAAKKILDPSYVTEAEADKINITLMNGNAQYGEKLTVSNATDAAKVTLPTVAAIPEGYSAFAGWALTAEIIDGEMLLEGSVGYDDVANIASDGELTLYARFTEEIAVDDNSLTVVFYDKFFDADKVEPLKNAFIEYCGANGITYGNLDFKCEITGNNAAFSTYLTDTIKGVYDVAVGSKQTNSTAVECLRDKTRVEITYVYDNKAPETREAVQNNERAITLAFIEFIQSKSAEDVLNPKAPVEDEKVVLKVAVYKKFVEQPVVDALETAFIKYCTDNSIAYDELHIDLITTGKGDAFTADAASYDVALGHKGGTSFNPVASATVTMTIINGGTTEVANDRKADRLTNSEIAVKFMEFLETDEGKAALTATSSEA